jgi:hypothetical protein
LGTLLLLGGAVIGSERGRSARESAALERIYAGEELAELHLELDADARASLAAAPREFVSGSLRFRGRSYGVGVRMKGHRSMRPLEEKPAFKLDFSRFEAGQTFLGARRLILNNLVEDPTLLREAIGYRFHGALGIASPRTGFAELFIDSEPYGVYLLVEAIDEAFLRRRFGDELGVLYEGEYGCDLYPEDVAGFERDVGKDPERAQLRDFAAAASAGPRSLFGAEATVLDTSSFLRYLAASAILGDFDGYRHAHNYRIYRDARDEKWQFLPWGLDRSLYRQLGVFDSNGLLARRCFDDRECRVEYVRTLRAAVDSWESSRPLDTARALGALIDEPAAADPRKPHDARAMSSARAALTRFIERRPDEIRRQLGCLDEAGLERDIDGDGHGCMDCDDRSSSIGPHALEICDGVDNDCSGLIDDAPACACPEVESGGATYQLCDLPMPWTDAEAFCEAKGLTLARIDSKATSRKLYQAARATRRDDWWIGYSDREREGAFRWPDGSAGPFTYWQKGQPNNRSCREDCAALEHGKRGRWHDTSCGQHKPFICAARSPLLASDAEPGRGSPDAGAAPPESR